MPVAMAFAAVDAMADTVDKAAEQIKDSLKS